MVECQSKLTFIRVSIAFWRRFNASYIKVYTYMCHFHRWGSLTRCHKATMFPVRILIALFPLQLAIETLHAIVINRTLKPETILAFSVHTMHCVAMANSQRRLCIEQRQALCLHLLLSNYSSFVIINLRSAQT